MTGFAPIMMSDAPTAETTVPQTTTTQTTDATGATQTNAQPLFARDTLYAQYFSAAPQFCFDAQVAAVFPDMIRRSVPGYGTALELIPAIAMQCLQPGDRVYDLGCSVGAGLLSVRQAITQMGIAAPAQASAPRPIELIGIDTSAEMLMRAKTLFDALPASVCADLQTRDNASLPHNYTVQFLEADITKVQLKPTKLVLVNYTLQFLPIEARTELINTLYHNLQPGGRLMLSEKVNASEAATESHLKEIHECFKRSQGYSALEVAGKRQALENVLLRETEQDHITRLKQAGFSRVTRLMQCLQFSTFLAEK